MTKLHTQQLVHDDHFLLPCVIHLSTSECSWMLFHLFYTLSEDSKAGCYLYLLSCQNFQKQHTQRDHEWSGKACIFVVLFSTKDSSFQMMSLRRPQRWSHFIRRAPLEDLREEKKILSIAGEDLLFVFWTKIRSLLGISSA